MSTTSQQHTELWDACRQFIKDNLTAAQFDTWFRDMTSVSFADGVLKLLVPSVFFYRADSGPLSQRASRGYKEGLRPRVHLEFLYPIKQGDPAVDEFPKGAEPRPPSCSRARPRQPTPSREPDRRDFDPQLNARYTFENYCLGESNKIARSIGEAIGDNPSLKTFNPLFVFGPSGVGKTHLIQAIGIRIKERNPQARVLYVTARLFQSQYTAAAAKNINSFFRFYRALIP